MNHDATTKPNSTSPSISEMTLGITTSSIPRDRSLDPSLQPWILHIFFPRSPLKPVGAAAGRGAQDHEGSGSSWHPTSHDAADDVHACDAHGTAVSWLWHLWGCLVPGTGLPPKSWPMKASRANALLEQDRASLVPSCIFL